MKVFTIGDNHWGHKNIIKYCKRPFKTVEEMDITMIENWNKTVKDKDVVIHVGDFALTNRENIKKIIDQLNGYIILISGNHDRITKTAWLDCGVLKYYQTFLKIKNSSIVFRHRPDYKLKKKIVIHGHIHEKKSKQSNHINVSAEQINYTPINVSKIVNYYQAGKIKRHIKAILEKEGLMNNITKPKKKEYIQPINEHFR